MASSVIQAPTQGHGTFTSSDSNINFLGSAQYSRYGKVVNITCAVKYSTANTTWTNITDTIFPTSAKLTGVSIYGSALAEAGAASAVDLSVRVRDGYLQAYGGTPNQMYLVNVTYIL